ncbi:hypothetical protein V496_03330 [Pseudogymnoascus sp. VKM F-4515 (FW-2607)]|nr:hypothetical protein V496_03330 [Pseudogymnoascus sp. VKM F-4515 (FW-2607)]
MEKNKVDATDMVDLECRDDAKGENADSWWGRHGVFENENENENAESWCRMHEDFVDEVHFEDWINNEDEDDKEMRGAF